jgi:IclR family transcriptional regulator, pca regulon regulatory protein
MTVDDAPHSRTFVTAFARGLAVIEAFGPEHRRMTLSEVAKAADLDRAVARRLLLTLTELGFVRVRAKHFELTTRVLRLGYAYLASVGLGASLQPYLDDLSRRINDTVSVSVLDGAEVVFIARSEVPGRRLFYNVSTGMRLPAFTASSGRVLLAARPRSEVEAMLAATKLDKLTPRTVVNRRNVMRTIQLAGANDYAVNVEEVEEGLISLSVPIRNRRGEVAAALNTSASMGRITRAQVLGRFLPPMRDTAMSLAGMLP